MPSRTLTAALLLCLTTTALTTSLLSAQEPEKQIVDAHELEPVKNPPRKKQQQQHAVRPRLDVVFAVDATSSMADEIDVIRKEIWSIANALASGKPSPDVRFGLVLYKDLDDDFVVRSTPLTRDIDAMHKQIMGITVSGGGDTPEHVGRGLHEALNLDWDKDQSVSKLIYLVGDAPSHQKEPQYSLLDAVRKAKRLGITIHTVGCSGLAHGQAEFKQIARATTGAFNPLTYHAVVTRDDGKEVSVVYFDGETFEANEVLSKEEWQKGGASLKKRKRLKPASPASEGKASRAKKSNNVGAAVTDSLKDVAAKKGVAY